MIPTLTVSYPHIKRAYFAKVSVGDDMTIERITRAAVTARVHLVVETENFRNRTLKVNIKQGIERVVADVNAVIAVQVGDEHKGLIEIQVGQFASETNANNRNEFLDHAIIAIELKASSTEATRHWDEAILGATGQAAPLYLLVDAHTGNTDVPQCRFSYYGRNEGTDSMRNLWLDMDGLWFQLKRTPAPWMEIAKGEIGQHEAGGTRINPRIQQYFDASGYWGTDDTGAENAWCGSFIAWVMTQHGSALPRASFRAKSWKEFGRQIDEPIYGAIGVKTRTGGGHTSFVVGKSIDGQWLFMLGGNQRNEVNVSRYARDVWSHFMVPSDYDVAGAELPVYDQSAVSAGSEA